MARGRFLGPQNIFWPNFFGCRFFFRYSRDLKKNFGPNPKFSKIRPKIFENFHENRQIWFFCHSSRIAMNMFAIIDEVTIIKLKNFGNEFFYLDTCGAREPFFSKNTSFKKSSKNEMACQNRIYQYLGRTLLYWIKGVHSPRTPLSFEIIAVFHFFPEKNGFFFDFLSIFFKQIIQCWVVLLTQSIHNEKLLIWIFDGAREQKKRQKTHKSVLSYLYFLSNLVIGSF